MRIENVSKGTAAHSAMTLASRVDSPLDKKGVSGVDGCGY